MTTFVPPQLGSDTSSIRSYGSNIGSYKSSPDTNRWRSSSYASPRDSSLAFATLNRGYVSSLKDRFSSTPTTGDRRLSFSRSLSGGRDYRSVVHSKPFHVKFLVKTVSSAFSEFRNAVCPTRQLKPSWYKSPQQMYLVSNAT